MNDKRDHEVRMLAAEHPDQLYTKDELKALVQELAETHADEQGHINYMSFIGAIKNL